VVAAPRLIAAAVDRRSEQESTLLALDWSGNQDQLLVGRDPGCDVVLAEPTVSRRHAQLFFRAGSWTVQDLESTNGTLLNGKRVGRCEVRPGDRLILGLERLRVD
jgi:pSer/pThr/pTyr-binding forkhead associated (FHA) protein